MASWLRGHCRLGQDRLATVRAGRTLEHLPAVAAGFAAGLITADQIAVIAPVTTRRTWPRPPTKASTSPRSTRCWPTSPPPAAHDQLRQVVQHYLARLDPDGPEPDPTEGRSLTITRHDDGTITGRFDLDAVGGEKVQTVLESFVQKDRPAGDLRTRAQQLGDALVQWADVTLAAGPPRCCAPSNHTCSSPSASRT